MMYRMYQINPYQILRYVLRVQLPHIPISCHTKQEGVDFEVSACVDYFNGYETHNLQHAA